MSAHVRQAKRWPGMEEVGTRGKDRSGNGSGEGGGTARVGLEAETSERGER